MTRIRPAQPVPPATDLRSVCVILPALDEAAALGVALAGRPKQPAALTGRLAGADVRVLVVDNGSSDNTAEVARDLGADVVVEPRRGFGAACWAGLMAAPAADIVVYMDADGSFDWADLEAVVGPVRDGSADLVLGHRRPDLREHGAMPWHISLANRALGGLCGAAAGVALHDLGPYRAIRRDALVALELTDRTYGWPLEMVLRAAHAGLRIQEVPVAYRCRTGTSKVTGRPWPTAKAAARMTMVLARHAVAVRRS